jgi:O-antigen/teichoic acid export membrane protein
MSSIKSFISETSIYGFGNTLSRFMGMLLIPLYARYLGKIDYSNLVMLQSGFSVFTFLLALNSGVFYYFYESEDKVERRGVFASWYYYQVAVAVALGLLLLSSSSYLVGLFIYEGASNKSIQVAICILALQFLPYTVNITNINLYRVQRKPMNVIRIIFTEALFVLLFTGIGLRFYGFGLTEVIAAQCLARFLVALIYLRDGRYYFPIRLISLSMIKKLFLYSWPFFLISTLSWVIVSIDKYIGAALLKNKEDVAYLALAMQLTIPISILSDMIRMAIGPYIMSIRKTANADRTYQSIFDLSVYTGVAVSICIIAVTPLMTKILADSTYIPVLRIVPLIAFASILSLMSNQIAISFSLIKKNTFILLGVASGSLAGFGVNLYLMPRIGYVSAGVAQLASYAIMGTLLYSISLVKTNNKIKLNNSSIILLIGALFGMPCIAFYNYISKLHVLFLAPIGILFLTLVTTVYLRQQEISWQILRNKLFPSKS